MKEVIYKFAHLSDLHLGARPKGIRQRKLDIFDAFSWVIDEIKSRKDINGVLFCGDTFHTKLVDWETMFRFDCEVSLLHDEEYDIFVIPGNHDFVPEFQWYRLYNYIINPSEQPFVNRTKNLCIYGVDWDTMANTTKVLDRLKRSIDKQMFNILMLHQAVEGHIFQDEKKSYITLKYLKGLRNYFDYIALGHIHHSYIVSNIAFNPGGIEYLNTSDWGARTGFYIVTAYNDKTFDYEFVETPKRKTYKINIPIDQLDKLDKDKILCYINDADIEPQSMLYIEFSGDKELSPKLIKEVEVDLENTYKPVVLKTRNFTRRERVEEKSKTPDPFDLIFSENADLARFIAQTQTINLEEL